MASIVSRFFLPQNEQTDKNEQSKMELTHATGFVICPNGCINSENQTMKKHFLYVKKTLSYHATKQYFEPNHPPSTSDVTYTESQKSPTLLLLVPQLNLNREKRPGLKFEEWIAHFSHVLADSIIPFRGRHPWKTYSISRLVTQF